MVARNIDIRKEVPMMFFSNIGRKEKGGWGVDYTIFDDQEEEWREEGGWVGLWLLDLEFQV